MSAYFFHQAGMKPKAMFFLHMKSIIIMHFFIMLFLVASTSLASTINLVEEDIEMKRVSTSQKSSAWLDSGKKMYHALLMRNRYDVLVVPFQVQGYAIDRPGRSLMTRYLAHRIESTSDSKLPSPTLVAKALGETERTYRDDEIYQLANDLGAKIVIRGYVGHHRDGKMKLTLFVQARDENGALGPATKTDKIEKTDLPFSDELLPSEVFCTLLDDIMIKLPLKQTQQYRVVTAREEKQLAIPSDPRGLFSEKHLTPVQRANYLQLMGSLYPEEAVGRDSLFERSLVALTEISPKSPDYALLKARAYYYLNRRPAAMAVLASAVRPEEKAFAAFLNGDMLALNKLIGDIKKPIPRLLSQIEFNDLRWWYGDKLRAKRSYKNISSHMPAWEMLVTRRLQGNDRWEVQSNLLVKQALDEYFPIPDYTAKSLFQASVALGDTASGNEDINFSVYNHHRRFIASQADRMTDNESSSLVERDLLDLLIAIGEANLLNEARLPITVQALPEQGLEIVRRFEGIYQDHPQLTYLKSFALWRIAATKQGQVKENTQNQADSTAKNACYWMQGQTFAGRKSCFAYNYYDGDYPRRSYWTYRSSLSQGGDRERLVSLYISNNLGKQKYSVRSLNELKNYELAVRYTVSDFEVFEAYYNKLNELGLTKEADDLLVKNQHRFIGHPSHAKLYARLQERTGNSEAAKKLYEEAINATPEIWGSYDRLGDLYIRQGEFMKAADIYRKYPLFTEGNDPDIDTVDLSNQAVSAGDNLWWHGAVEQALPFYRLSAGYQTGSGAGMSSSVSLSLFQGNYHVAAGELRELATRYSQIRHYSEYVTLLHLIGYGDEAWSIFKSRNFMSSLDEVKRSIVVAHRIEGKTEEQQRQWLFQQDLKNIPLPDIQSYIVSSHLYDRPVDENLPSIIDGVAEKMASSAYRKHMSWWAWFVNGYNNIRLQRYSTAYDIFCGRRDPPLSYYTSNYSLPYGVWSGVKSGHLAEVVTTLKTYKEKYGETFYYHLAQAFILANQKNHKNAIKHLEAARATMWAKEWQYFPWYQLVEACEWLYEDTAYIGYRDLVLKFAKICQKIRYESAWSYAVEAKYTDSESDRLRALGITLYLDKRSERISRISDNEKQKALAWLKKNNPFIRASSKSATSEI